MIRRADEYFKTSSQTLHEVLKDNMYRIPEYQRVFAWSKKGGEFEVLWSDIVKAELLAMGGAVAFCCLKSFGQIL